jgi:hypothetical protein
LTPSSVLDAFIEARLGAGPVRKIATVPVGYRCGSAAQVCWLNGFHVDHVVLTDQCERRLMVKVCALPAHTLMPLLQQLHSLTTAVAPLLALAYPLLRLLQLALGFAIVSGILHCRPLSGDEKHLQPHINAGLASRLRQRLRRHVCT